MDKYVALLRPNKAKKEFLFSFISIFSELKSIEDIEFYKNIVESVDYKRLKSLTRQEAEREKLHNFESTELSRLREINMYKNISFLENEVLKVSIVQFALIDKVEHILFYRGGLLDVIIMLSSFKRGVKKLKTCQTDYYHEKNYNWTNKNGNEKLSHEKNLKKAHFKWNIGERYVLPNEDIEKINRFISPIVKYI